MIRHVNEIFKSVDVMPVDNCSPNYQWPLATNDQGSIYILDIESHN